MDLRLKDGSFIELRPIRPDDAEREERFFRRVSAESIYWRFFHSKRMLSPDEVHHLTNVDYQDRMAIIAVHEDEMVAVGRYDVIPGRTHGAARIAEIAFLVEDDFQGRGLGTLLLRHLTAYARSTGVGAFEANVLPSNHRMLRLFRTAGYTLVPLSVPDVYVVEFPASDVSTGN